MRTIIIFDSPHYRIKAIQEPAASFHFVEAIIKINISKALIIKINLVKHPQLTDCNANFFYNSYCAQ